MSEIKTKSETLPVKTDKTQEDNRFVSVWEYAGNLLVEYKLERNAELQYSLFKWLRKNNTKETGGLCEDGFFDYGATVISPCDRENVLRTCTTALRLDYERKENIPFKNDIAIIGNDRNDNPRFREANIKSFHDAAERAGYKEESSNDRIVYKNSLFDFFSRFEFVTKSGKDAIYLLKENGSRDNPITGIFFSTHGTPYAVDFNNPGNNLYIPDADMKALYERTHKNKKWNPGWNVAYVDDLARLVLDGIVAEDVTIILCGCLNGGRGETVPEKAEAVSQKWAEENMGKKPKNIAWYISKAIPKATVIANRTQVDSGKGLNRPIMYRNGEIIE